MPFLLSLVAQASSTVPLFILLSLGYGLVRLAKWPKAVTDALTRFVFSIAIPIMLFKIMASFYTQPTVNPTLLIAFFGGCLLVFFISRLIGHLFFKLDGVSGSVFAIGGILSNNVVLGIPIITLFLGTEALPAVAMVLVFNVFILWTLVTVSVEWARYGSFSVTGIMGMLKGVIKNPIIIGIICGQLVSLTHHPLPFFVERPAEIIAQMAAPLSLIALGMGLAEYRITEGWRISVCICVVKLLIHPLVIWGLAVLFRLPPLETQVVVLMGSMAMGINIYLMARQFNALTAPIASSLVLSTLLSIITTPLIFTLMIQVYG